MSSADRKIWTQNIHTVQFSAIYVHFKTLALFLTPLFIFFTLIFGETLLVIKFKQICSQWKLLWSCFCHASVKSTKGSILQYFWPSLSYHLSLRSLFCLFLGGCFTQVLLYTKICLPLMLLESFSIKFYQKHILP